MPDKGKGDIQEVCKVTGGKLCSCLEFCIGQPKESAGPRDSSEPPSEPHPEGADQGPRVVSIGLSEVHRRLVATQGNGFGGRQTGKVSRDVTAGTSLTCPDTETRSPDQINDLYESARQLERRVQQDSRAASQQLRYDPYNPPIIDPFVCIPPPNSPYSLGSPFNYGSSRNPFDPAGSFPNPFDPLHPLNNPFNPWTTSVSPFRSPLDPPHPLDDPFHPLNSSVALAYGLNTIGQSRGTIGEQAQGVHIPYWRIVRPDVEPVTEGEDDAEGEEMEPERGRRRDKGS